jgi:glycosyltransferase involved in cell wall biosynthesis
MSKISVILATHNRAVYLEACLVSLCAQTLDPLLYEICVVDNACTDATPEVVAAIAKRYPNHRVFMVEEPTPGLSRARNCGIAATSTPFIATIDDDATAEPDWLERLLNRFAALPDDVGGIGGEIDPVWQAPPPPWLDARMKGVLTAASGMGTAPRFIDPQEGLFECNSCYRRAALEAAGCYPVELGRVGNLLLSGEGAVNALIRHKGWRLFFDPAVIVHHIIHAERLTPRWLRKRLFWQGISDYAMHLYYQRNGLTTVTAMNLDLPLKQSDWAFVNADTAENLSDSLTHFESLGFALAMAGLVDIDNG